MFHVIQAVSVWVVSIVGWLGLLALGAWFLDRAIVYGLGVIGIWKPLVLFIIARRKAKKTDASA